MQWAILIKFDGEWGIWRKDYKTQQKATSALKYWKERMSWPLMIERIKI